MFASEDALEQASRARVSYPAVGASSDPALMRFPPKGYAPFERRVRVGHGDRRWGFVVDELMTWRIKTGAGFQIARRVADAGQEPPVEADSEPVYSADGERYASPGETAVLTLRGLPFSEPVRVISVIDGERRRGFVYGTLPGHPLQGEEQLFVEQREDGGVWLVVRSFARPSSRRWRLLAPALWLVRRIVITRYADVLSRKI